MIIPYPTCIVHPKSCTHHTPLTWMSIGSLISEPIFIERIEEIMKTMISNTLFQDCAIASHALLEGFWFSRASFQL